MGFPPKFTFMKYLEPDKGLLFEMTKVNGNEINWHCKFS